MSAPTLRPATDADAARITAFQCGLARETEGEDLDPALVERGVRRVLADPGRGRYLVAERAGEVVGSLMLTREWSDWRDGWWWWIQSVYTAPEARRAGIYRALYARVRAEAEADPRVLGLRLYVERDNSSARAAYEGLGMERSTYRFYQART